MRSSELNPQEIGETMRKIAEERLRNLLQCECRPSDDGKSTDYSRCPLHRPVPEAYLACGLRLITEPEGGW